jgi:hypothetical protein
MISMRYDFAEISLSTDFQYIPKGAAEIFDREYPSQ